MNEQLAAIKARREAALPVNPHTSAASSTQSMPTLFVAGQYPNMEAMYKATLLAKFVNAAPADIDTLLAHVAALTAERDEARALHRLVCAKFDEAVRERDALAQQLQQAQAQLAAVPVDAIRKMRFDVEVELHGYTNAELDEWLDAEQEAANAAAELRAPTYNGGCW